MAYTLINRGRDYRLITRIENLREECHESLTDEEAFEFVR